MECGNYIVYLYRDARTKKKNDLFIHLWTRLNNKIYFIFPNWHLISNSIVLCIMVLVFPSFTLENWSIIALNVYRKRWREKKHDNNTNKIPMWISKKSWLGGNYLNQKMRSSPLDGHIEFFINVNE